MTIKLPFTPEGIFCSSCSARIPIVLIGHEDTVQQLGKLELALWCDNCAKNSHTSMDILKVKIKAMYPEALSAI